MYHDKKHTFKKRTKKKTLLKKIDKSKIRKTLKLKKIDKSKIRKTLKSKKMENKVKLPVNKIESKKKIRKSIKRKQISTKMMYNDKFVNVLEKLEALMMKKGNISEQEHIPRQKKVLYYISYQLLMLNN